jgi:hypothetical protein
MLLLVLTAVVTVSVQTVSAVATNRYVNKNNAGAQAPYDAWTNAAADIQTAVNYAYAGETVIVAAATYDSGGTVINGLTNRVVLTNAITLISSNNDPTVTIIKGNWDPASSYHGCGTAAVRCVYMSNACLIGFMITNGATLAASGSIDGGGIYCASSVTISNCINWGIHLTGVTTIHCGLSAWAHGHA